MANSFAHVLPILLQLTNDNIIVSDDVAAMYSCVKRGMYSNTTDELRRLIISKKTISHVHLVTLSSLAVALCAADVDFESSVKTLPHIVQGIRMGLDPSVRHELDGLESVVETIVEDIKWHKVATPNVSMVVDNAVLLTLAGIGYMNRIVSTQQDAKSRSSTRRFSKLRIMLAILSGAPEVLSAVLAADYLDAEPDPVEGNSGSGVPQSEPFMLSVFGDPLIKACEHPHDAAMAMLETLFHHQPNIDTQRIRSQWVVQSTLSSASVLPMMNLMDQMGLGIGVPYGAQPPPVDPPTVPHWVSDPLILKVCQLTVESKVDQAWEDVLLLLHPNIDPIQVEKWHTFHTTVRDQRKLLSDALQDLTVVNMEVRFYHDGSDPTSDSLGHQIHLAYFNVYGNQPVDTELKVFTVVSQTEVFDSLSMECKRFLSITTIDDLVNIQQYIQHYCR